MPYQWNGGSYAAAGTYSTTLANAVGCDSVATLVLGIKATSSSTTNVTVCNNQLPYEWNGGSYAAAGTYSTTLANAVGCDSVATLVLGIKATSSSTTNVTVCNNQLPYEWNGISYSIGGTYFVNISSGNNCDSIATLVLSINNTTTSNTGVAICSSELPYNWNGVSYPQGGVYTQLLTNAAGCDSIAKLYLDVAPALQIFEVTGGGSYQQGGPGLQLGLNGSTLGVNYQLLLNGAALGAPLLGTGNALDFGMQYTPGNYTISGAPGTLCSALMNGNATITITSNPPAVFAVTGGGSYCSNASGVAVGLSGSQLNVNYQLFRGGGNIAVGSPVAGTGNAIGFGLQSIADQYTIVATNQYDAQSTNMANAATIRIISSTLSSGMPNVISGPANACIYLGQGTATYKINAIVNATSYLWTTTAGINIIGSNIDTTLTVQYSSSFVSGSISIVSKNSCTNTTSTARTLNISKSVPTAPTTIIGAVDVCSAFSGSSSLPVTYKVNKVTNATSYQWTLPTGASIAAYGDSSIDVLFSSSFVSGNIVVTSVSPCGNSTTSRSLTVYKRVAATPAAIQKSFVPNVLAVTNVCGYDTQTYRINKVTYATSYNWTMKNGTKATITHLNPLGANDTAVLVTFLSGYTIDSLQVQSVTACSISAVKLVALTKILASPTVATVVASTGNFAPCIGNSVNYIATSTTPSSTQSPIAVFRWTMPNKAIIIAATSDSATITVRFDVGYTGGSIGVKGQTACGVQGTAKSTMLRYATPTPSSITSSTASYNACIGTTVSYTVVTPAPSTSQVGAVLYRWTKPNNTSIVSANADSSTITLQFNTGYTGGNITAKGQTICGVMGTAKSQALTHTGCTAGTKLTNPIALTSMDFQTGLKEIKVFPNPSTVGFEMLATSNTKEPINVQVLDLQGRMIAQYQAIGGKRLKFGAELKAGIYLLKVKQKDELQTIKLMKQ